MIRGWANFWNEIFQQRRVTVHEHPDGKLEVLWGQRQLTYGTLEKPVRQSKVADGKPLMNG